ncbi:MAG: glycosyl transferase group 1 [Gemmatimonadetes bacterium]|nr:glycosyl transferase group 1 [Gemmatimonadota bacterium]
MTRPLRVVQVGFHVDAEQRDAKSLLRAWPTLSAVAKASAGAGVHVTVVQAAHRKEIVERDGVTYYFVDDTSRRPARVFDRVASLAPDVVHIQGLSAPRATRPLSRAVPHVPILIQDHGSVVPAGWRANAWRLAHSPIAGVAFTTREQAAPWKRAKVLRRNLPVFEVLESSSDFTPGDRDEARRATGMSGEPCLFWTGRLDANKDPLTMLAAFELAAAKLPDAWLYCCFGDAPMLAEVERRIALSEILSRRVALLGRLPHEELETRYRAADFFVQTSHREGSGYSLLEAMACGTTPIVTDIPAARAIVGDAGSLTKVGDAPAMAEAIVKWTARNRVDLRRATRLRFDAALTFDAIGGQLRAAYEALVGVRGVDATLKPATRAPMIEELR